MSTTTSTTARKPARTRKPSTGVKKVVVPVEVETELCPELANMKGEKMITLLALAAELDMKLGLIQETAYRICIDCGDDFRADHEAFLVLTSGRIDFTGLEITEGLAERVRDAIHSESDE